MAGPKRKGRGKGILKNFLWGMTCLSLSGLLSCNSGTGSSTSSAGSSGTGTGWTITIQLGTNPIPFTGSSTTTVMAIVKDRTGTPAPRGTNICFTAVLNGFLKPGASELFATLCEGTNNDRGQSIQTYQGKLSAGVDTIEVASQGVVARASIGVN